MQEYSRLFTSVILLFFYLFSSNNLFGEVSKDVKESYDRVLEELEGVKKLRRIKKRLEAAEDEEERIETLDEFKKASEEWDRKYGGTQVQEEGPPLRKTITEKEPDRERERRERERLEREREEREKREIEEEQRREREAEEREERRRREEERLEREREEQREREAQEAERRREQEERQEEERREREAREEERRREREAAEIVEETVTERTTPTGVEKVTKRRVIRRAPKGVKLKSISKTAAKTDPIKDLPVPEETKKEIKEEAKKKELEEIKEPSEPVEPQEEILPPEEEPVLTTDETGAPVLQTGEALTPQTFQQLSPVQQQQAFGQMTPQQQQMMQPGAPGVPGAPGLFPPGAPGAPGMMRPTQPMPVTPTRPRKKPSLILIGYKTDKAFLEDWARLQYRDEGIQWLRENLWAQDDMPAAPAYQAPVQPQYQPPAQPQYPGAPVQPQYRPPPQPQPPMRKKLSLDEIAEAEKKLEDQFATTTDPAVLIAELKRIGKKISRAVNPSNVAEFVDSVVSLPTFMKMKLTPAEERKLVEARMADDEKAIAKITKGKKSLVRIKFVDVVKKRKQRIVKKPSEFPPDIIMGYGQLLDSLFKNKRLKKYVLSSEAVRKLVTKMYRKYYFDFSRDLKRATRTLKGRILGKLRLTPMRVLEGIIFDLSKLYNSIKSFHLSKGLVKKKHAKKYFEKLALIHDSIKASKKPSETETEARKIHESVINKFAELVRNSAHRQSMLGTFLQDAKLLSTKAADYTRKTVEGIRVEVDLEEIRRKKHKTSKQLKAVIGDYKKLLIKIGNSLTPKVDVAAKAKETSQQPATTPAKKPEKVTTSTST